MNHLSWKQRLTLAVYRAEPRNAARLWPAPARRAPIPAPKYPLAQWYLARTRGDIMCGKNGDLAYWFALRRWLGQAEQNAKVTRPAISSAQRRAMYRSAHRLYWTPRHPA